MSSLGIASLAPTGCAVLVPGTPTLVPGTQGPAATEPIAVREPERTGQMSGDQLARLWQIFDYIGLVWESRKYCAIQGPRDFEPIINLKTSQAPSYLVEYSAALEHFRRLSEEFEPLQALHRLYFGDVDAHLKQFVVIEFLRLHIANGGFRFLPYQNMMGFAGGPFNDDERLPYRNLDESC